MLLDDKSRCNQMASVFYSNKLTSVALTPVSLLNGNPFFELFHFHLPQKVAVLREINQSNRERAINGERSTSNKAHALG